MPTYEFYCEKCKKSFELTMKISEYGPKKKIACPKCQGTQVTRRVSAFQTITAKKS